MNKIEALEKTIYNLENDVYEYEWLDADSCNCGILARTIMGGKKPFDAGYSDSLFIKTTKNYDGVFSKDFRVCEVSGLPLPLVFKSLKDVGFTYEELYNLEFLIQDGERGNFKNKESVIQYLKAWVKMLKEQEEERSVASKEQSELVSLETKRKNITKSLAVFPVEEKSDLKTLNEVV